MPSRVEVVRSVVSIVEADTVAHDVYHRDARSEVGIWVDFVDEGVLAPITNHESEAEDGEREEEHECACFGIESGHVDEECVAGEFCETGADGEIGFALFDEVDR